MSMNKGEISVLLVDDHMPMRSLLESALRKMGVNNILHAKNAERALKEFRTKKPDLVFLDINMPDMNGLDVLKEIIEIEKDAFVAMVSGENTVSNVKQAISSGAKGFIVKPYTLAKVLGVMKKFDGRFEYDSVQ